MVAATRRERRRAAAWIAMAGSRLRRVWINMTSFDSLYPHATEVLTLRNPQISHSDLLTISVADRYTVL